jgi:hypothetical protein
MRAVAHGGRLAPAVVAASYVELGFMALGVFVVGGDRVGQGGGPAAGGGVASSGWGWRGGVVEARGGGGGRG